MKIAAIFAFAILAATAAVAQTAVKPVVPAAPAVVAPAKPVVPAAPAVVAPAKPVAAAPAAAAPVMTDDAKKMKSKDCSAKADVQKLHGKMRKKFRDECKKAA